MPKFRKKPVVIEAVQLLWTTWSEMCVHAGVGKLTDGKPEGCWVDSENKIVDSTSSLCDGRIALAIPTLEGLMVGVEGDWIIKGVKGELYPCKPDIFEATYELVDSPSQNADGKLENFFMYDGSSDGWTANTRVSLLETIDALIDSLEDGDEEEIIIRRQSMTQEELDDLPAV